MTYTKKLTRLALGAALATALAASLAPAASAQKFDSTGNSIANTYEDAIAALKRNQFRDAESKFDTVLGRMSTDANANYLMARAKIGLEKWPDAKKYLNTAITLKPDHALARAYLGAIYLQEEKMPEAQAQADEIMKLKAACAGTCKDAADIEAAIKVLTG